ncbi:WD40 repeat-like protein [Artomyces pyxidatus]|uniref:WD40 repeat-like protein n=1 Tax=Artomyces pyxidatus TaxID=48021 RepID=A0ACB8TI48_9AGAM|nr:WD40 repeat-like protein [Artomyces pyxidatus]
MALHLVWSNFFAVPAPRPWHRAASLRESSIPRRLQWQRQNKRLRHPDHHMKCHYHRALKSPQSRASKIRGRPALSRSSRSRTDLQKPVRLLVLKRPRLGRGSRSPTRLPVNSPLCIRRTGGACRLLALSSVWFTRCHSYFFTIVGSTVKIYSVATGHVVSTLSASPSDGAQGDTTENHTGVITCMILNPHNAFQLITGSLDGHVKMWNFLDGVLLQTWDVGQAVHHVAAHEKLKDLMFVSVARPNKKKNAGDRDDNGVVLRVVLKPTTATANSPVLKPSEMVIIGKTRTTQGLGVSPSGLWLVGIGGHKAYVASTSNFRAGFVKFVSPEALKCLAFHPTEEYFATGDDKGSIRLWYCLDEKIVVNVANVEKRAPTTTLHWHAHAVSALAFTPNGAYLLSGGEESVLVIWQLHSGKKEFVPRVGAPILSVTASRTGEEEYLLGLADSSFVFINAARMKISRSYSRIKLDPAVSHSRPSSSTSVPLTVHSLTSTLILPSSHPSSLQTYSPSSSKLLFELEVSPSNRVSRKDEKMLEPSRVEQAVISSSGEWLATIDSRTGDESFRGEVYLKIWQWDKSSGFWILNTRVGRPHGLKKVTSTAFSPAARDATALLLVTTGEDGNVKSWRIRTLKEKRTGLTEVFWVLRSTFTFRQETPRHVSWSPDGSIFAVSFGPYVSLYDPFTNALIQALTAPQSCDKVLSSHFVGHGGRYLAAVGSTDIVLWDLVTQSAQWHHRSPTPISATVSQPSDETFAVFRSLPALSNGAAPLTHVSIFTHTSSIPRKTYTLPFGLRSIAWYPSSPVQQAPGSFSLVGITDTWSVVLFGDDIRAPSESGSAAKGLVDGASGPQKRTLFHDIFGESAFVDVSITHPRPPVDNASRSWNGKELTDIFDAPAYLMPPLETLFDSLMSGFLQPRPAMTEEPVKARRTANGDGSEDEDEEMDVDEDASQSLLNRPPDRIVDGYEMDTFIELFRQHAVKGEFSGLPSSLYCLNSTLLSPHIL